MRATHRMLVGALAASSAGCITAPDYKRPEVVPAVAFRGAEPRSSVDVTPLGDQRWWDVFQDDVLRDLIRAALQHNNDLGIAAARVLEARATLGITRAAQFPTVTASATVTNQRVPEALGRPAFETSGMQVGVSVAWEADFWGKFSRATDSARASLLAEQWAERSVVSSLVSDVASAYFQLREQDLELEISRQTLETRADSLRLTKLLADRGATSLLDVRQAEQLVFSANAAIPDLERRIEQQENAISILIGRNPGIVARGRRLVDQPRPPEIPAGVASALLERRPDILQAEQQLISANAEIGVATAALFPQIALTGDGGARSSALTRLLTGPAGWWTLGASALQPVFERDRTRNRIRVAEARAAAATWAYRRTVQGAFREVSDALVGYRKGREVRGLQQRLSDAAAEATTLSNMRYRAGAASYLEVLDSETRVFAARLELARAEFRELEALVQVYRALGGGWSP